MRNILNDTLPELTAWMTEELGEPRFRAAQVWQWIWQKGARDFSEMTDVSKACRARLAETARIVWPEVVTVQESRDGTTKFLLGMEDGAQIETVLIPSEDREGNRRWTQCLSSQVGCAMGCTFCSTGDMGFERNLTHGEILGQILVARAHLGDNRPDWPILRNLVFMGMGEPLLNLGNVMRALESLNNDRGLNFSPAPHYGFHLRHRKGPAGTGRVPGWPIWLYPCTRPRRNCGRASCPKPRAGRCRNC